jgi:membrane protease YdiL (CAAX protease family)
MNELEPVQAAPVNDEMETAQPYKPTLRRLFFGDDGLRAGWGVLLFVLLLIGTSLLAGLIISHFHLLPKPNPKAPQPKEQSFRGFLSSEGLFFIVLMIAGGLMSLIERRPFSRYGFAAKRMPSDFLIGLGWGLLCLSLLVGILLATHTLAFDGVLLHGAAALVYALKWLFGFFLVGLVEEFLFRGYLQYTVSRGVAGIVRALDPNNPHSFQWGFWIAAFLFSGVFFMLAHTGNTGETFTGIIGVGLAGAIFAFSLYRTGSLWWAIGFHTSWDWAQSYLYGVHDSGTVVAGHLLASHPMGRELISGGPDGPEGSIFLIPVFLLTLAIIHFTLPKRDYFLTPDQSPLPAHTESAA